jgi:hypothetical protein
VRPGLAILLIASVLLAGSPGRADNIRTDANIVTGLDLSGSIEARDVEIQIDGIAMAIRSPEIMAAIQRGNFGRIGFSVFVWADGNYPVLLSWRMIGSAEDALAVSNELSTRLHAIIGSDVVRRLGALTDLSGALDYAGEMLQEAPFAASHRIINIIGNGIDNVGDGSPPSRDRLVAQGITINGVTLGHDRSVYEYFKREVIGGPTAFVLPATDAEQLVAVLERKFVNEIVLNADATGQPFR